MKNQFFHALLIKPSHVVGGRKQPTEIKFLAKHVQLQLATL